MAEKTPLSKHPLVVLLGSFCSGISVLPGHFFYDAIPGTDGDLNLQTVNLMFFVWPLGLLPLLLHSIGATEMAENASVALSLDTWSLWTLCDPYKVSGAVDRPKGKALTCGLCLSTWWEETNDVSSLLECGSMLTSCEVRLPIALNRWLSLYIYGWSSWTSWKLWISSDSTDLIS